ncbi:hypothetical protein TNCT_58901 [Trichonephila clavata]|uniref:Uncharacterized protein n=1 Tax=Trichonephila clavata TaxID=2740835 RepID=A0A8X6KEU1_TRICU|nr:hypothetical protein TNCT_58901 [Trichonephila clavata]
MKDINDMSRNFKHCKKTAIAHGLMPHSVLFPSFVESLVETGFEPLAFLNIADGEANDLDHFLNDAKKISIIIYLINRVITYV